MGASGMKDRGGKAAISVPKRIVERPFDRRRNRKALNFPSVVIEKAYCARRGPSLVVSGDWAASPQGAPRAVSNPRDRPP